MSLPYTQEQLELKDTLHRFLGEHCNTEFVRHRIKSNEITDKDLWHKLNELGLVSSFATEESGGVGLGFRELGIVAYESGWFLLTEPLLSAAFFGSYFLTQILDKDSLSLIESDLVLSVVEGKRRVIGCLESSPVTVK